MINATLADLLDIGKLIYNVAVSVVLALLQALAQTGIAWARGAIEREFTNTISPKSALQCLPLKVFAFSVLGGLDLMEQEIMAYLKDFFTMQESAIKLVQIASEQSKFNDMLDHIDKALEALDAALQSELICKNGVAEVLHDASVGPTGADITLNLPDAYESLNTAPRIIAMLTEKAREATPINPAGTIDSDFGPISAAELIQFYQSFLHYTPAQTAQAMTGDWSGTKDRMSQLAAFVPEFNTMVSAGACLDKLSPTARQEAEQRIKQLQELEK
jgi:hypothetical protein